jgi:hypothetical protein
MFSDYYVNCCLCLLKFLLRTNSTRYSFNTSPVDFMNFLIFSHHTKIISIKQLVSWKAVAMETDQCKFAYFYCLKDNIEWTFKIYR